jgi:uncharacterized membrane protein
VLQYFWHCHRLQNRSFFYKGKQFPVCARCTGVWLGYLFGLLVIIIFTLPWWVGLILLIPALLDGGTQLLNLRTSTNDLRFTTGLILGVGEMILFGVAARWTITLGYWLGQNFFQ